MDRRGWLKKTVHGIKHEVFGYPAGIGLGSPLHCEKKKKMEQEQNLKEEETSSSRAGG